VKPTFVNMRNCQILLLMHVKILQKNELPAILLIYLSTQICDRLKGYKETELASLIITSRTSQIFNGQFRICQS